jgi:hypothetical protein
MIDGQRHLAEYDNIADRHRRAQLAVGPVVAIVAAGDSLGKQLDSRSRVRNVHNVHNVAPSLDESVTALVGPPEPGIDIRPALVDQPATAGVLDGWPR